MAEAVGLRPCRKGGVRLELDENYSGKHCKVIHFTRSLVYQVKYVRRSSNRRDETMDDKLMTSPMNINKLPIP